MRRAVTRAPLLLAVLCASCLAPPAERPPGTTVEREIGEAPLFRDEDELRRYVAKATQMRAIVEDHENRLRLEAIRESRSAWSQNGEVPFEFGGAWPSSTAGIETWVVTGTSAAAGQLALASSKSVVSFDSAELSALGASSISDVASFTPNLEITGAPSITNNQEAGVDEGDIVKRMGDFIVLLRRGRLYSLDIGPRPGAAIRVVDRRDVFPFPGEHHAWYDELLVDGDHLVVLGYDYGSGGTEIALFELDARGRLFHVETYAIRSNDYYSWENYGSRLVDGRLVFYLPIDLGGLDQSGDSYWPSYSTYGWLGLRAEWRPLVDSMRIQRPLQADFPTTLHAVVQCEIADGRLACDAQGIVGGWGATHYVSRTAFYLWLGGSRSTIDALALTLEDLRGMLSRGELPRPSGASDAFLYRLPFDGSEPGAVALVGEPDDQFSFRERSGLLDVLLVTGREPIRDREQLSLARIELERFAEPEAEILRNELLPLPKAFRPWGCMNHRFVADHLLYSSCDVGLPHAPVSGVFVHDLMGVAGTEWFEIAGSIDRIERLGSDALVIGETVAADEDSIALAIRPILLGSQVEAAPGAELPFLVEAESRSHAFNFTDWGEDLLFGLPAQHLQLEDGRDPHWLWGTYDLHPHPRTTGLISFFRMTPGGALEEVGRIAESESNKGLDDDCEISCVDWYGSLRPFFIDDRIFALLDYELVEAEMRVGRLREVQRAQALREGR